MSHIESRPFPDRSLIPKALNNQNLENIMNITKSIFHNLFHNTFYKFVFVFVIILEQKADSKRFRKVYYCLGAGGCALNVPAYSVSASIIEMPPVEFVPSSIQFVPNLVKCAYYCQTRLGCVSFNYLSQGFCNFYEDYPYLIYVTSGCVYYEVSCYNFPNYKEFSISNTYVCLPDSLLR